MTVPEALLEEVRRVTADLPPDELRYLVQVIEAAAAGQWRAMKAQTQGISASTHYREQVGRLIERWQELAPTLEPAALALTLRTAGYCAEAARRSQTLELVWTGPSSTTPLRRTDQVLLDLIGQSQRDLLLVTFAVYDIPDIRQALIAAAERGVRLHLIIESPQASAGKVAYDGLRALGPAVAARAQVYRLPLEKRPRDAYGKHGSLHAKCAVADEATLLISSANLTDYALTLNMEMGLLVRGGPLPGQVRWHFQRLIDSGILIATN